MEGGNREKEMIYHCVRPISLKKNTKCRKNASAYIQRHKFSVKPFTVMVLMKAILTHESSIPFERQAIITAKLFKYTFNKETERQSRNPSLHS